MWDRPGKTWSYCVTKHIGCDDIARFPNAPWDWYSVSRSPYLEVGFAVRNPDLPWDWEEISPRQDLTLEMVEDNKHLPWVEHSLWTNSALRKQGDLWRLRRLCAEVRLLHEKGEEM